MAARRKALARDIVVVGAGVSKFGTFPGKTSRDLLGEAYSEALTSVDKGVDPNEIEALYLGNYSSDLFENQGHTAPLMADWLGLLPKPAVRVEGACGSSALAFREGIISIASGLYDTVMIAGVEKMSNLPTEGVTDALATASDTIYEFNQAGYTFPGVFAIIASAYFNSYGATREHLMRVAIKNHQNGALNPKAQFTVTLHEMMESRRQRLQERGLPVPKWRDELDFLNDPQSNPTVAWPLSLFDCAPITDGASCVILTAKETAHNFTDRPVHVAGTAHASGGALSSWSDLSSMPSAQVAARQAYEMAGVTPNQIDLAEVHDCFTIAEIVATEDLGFFPRGQGALAAAEGQTARDGVKPINTSGGLKAKGHPVGATGTAQITEIWKQLRGDAEGRQVPNKNVEFGLTHNVGGTGGTCVIHILRRD